MNLIDKPLACAPYTSYRCMGRYGWIMIGAMSHEDAIREAFRSSPEPKLDTLEVWDGKQYVKSV